MNDIASYLVTLAGETAAALPSKVYDPIAWLALCGALLIGTAIGFSRSPAWRRGWFILFIAFIPFLVAYTSRGGLSNGDSGALVLLYIIGLYAGQLLVPRLLGRSVQRS
ncbi:MAG: hypothetical protein WAN86_19055 [Hyphomicrobiaceae bacterium]